ncbi:FprA family A-type flavoprotein [Inconstantimicrobium mannanitabidum]|uniref:Uncharacterized protein n=1 Tax=Inconstantimicrobium mannanitabidum TaxID=1604901 RepID=A0ACB5RDJ1_9CLOT|nr:FprA family A-type flavoprotein [Clostridium sp. TW13]GKX67108.1 hypothetical protein rsdtw13_23660 [Clostridium sp. TW13]
MENVKSISPDLFWVGSLDPNLKVFDVIMETEFGTTYNSYLLKGTEGTAIFETVKDKFFDDYLEKIKSLVDPSTINYIVVNHTEPDHSGSAAKLLEYAPNATVVGSSQAILFLQQIVNKPFKSQVVKEGETLNLGNKTIRFISAPNLHWPDTMYSYVEEEKTLITCDSFGAHYCSDKIFRNDLEKEKDAEYLKAFKFYFDMIIGPFKPFVLTALTKINDLDIKYICPGHGMVLSGEYIDKYKALYKEWSTVEKRKTPSIILGYVSAYGFTEKLANKIAEGIKSTNDQYEVLVYDLSIAKQDEVIKEIEQASGLLIGSPTILADALPPVLSLLYTLNPAIHKGKYAACFGSYGWSGEATKNIQQRFVQLKFKTPLEPLKIKFNPSDEELQQAFDFGVEFVKSMQ